MFSNLLHTIKRNIKIELKSIPGDLEKLEVFEFNADLDFYKRDYYKFLGYKGNYAEFENLITKEKKFIFYTELEKLIKDNIVKLHYMYFESITNLYKILDMVKRKQIEFYISGNRIGLPQLIKVYKIKHLTEVKNNYIKVYINDNDRYYEYNLSIYEFPDELTIIE